MNLLVSGRLLILAISLIVLGLMLVFLPEIKAQTGYQPGLQHLYPYYVPHLEENQALLQNIYYVPLDGENEAQQVYNFSRRHLRLNPLGAIILGAGLHHSSGLDPLFNNQGYCGLAAWPCEGERWQHLLNFSRIYDFDHQELKTQLIFINLELNGLGQTIGSYGVYQNVYDDLKDADNFTISSSFFTQTYLGKTPVNLTSIAQTLYDYDPAIDYNELEPEPEPIPIPEPVVPQPATASPTTGCRAGLDTGYIAVDYASDQNGSYLQAVTIRKYSSNEGATKTLMHRCIDTQINDLLRAYNAQVSSEDNKLGGWGWRSNQKQIELRKRHCGQSHQDIYEKPADQCLPPTARPGLSSHQDGLAIDFYCKDKAVTKTNCGNAFIWLDCNAAKYGLLNLESEPWHWFHPLVRPERIQAKLDAGC